MAKSCLCAIAGALPPDFVDTSLAASLEKQGSVDAQGHFDPKPVSTAKSVISTESKPPPRILWLIKLFLVSASPFLKNWSTLPTSTQSTAMISGAQRKYALVVLMSG